MKPSIACLAVGLLVAGCGGQPTRPPATEVTRIPESGGWFCQLAPSGEGWKCVQDPALAEDPQPERLPEPPAEPAAESSRIPEPPARPAIRDREVAPTVSDEVAPTVSDEVAPTELDEVAPDRPDEPTSAPPPDSPPAPPEPAPNAAGAGASPNSRAGYARLAYQPEEPVALADLPRDFYALQIVAMDTREELERFAERHGIRGASAARVERDGSLFYVLVLGVYETLTKARDAAADLPGSLAGIEPWIRPVGSLQAAMMRGEALAAQ